MMRRLFLLGLLGLGMGLLVPNVQAQFAGCATPAELPYAARFVLHGLYDMKFSVTVIGVDGFNPQVMLRSSDGKLVGCNNDSTVKAGAEVALPTAQTVYNDHNAYLPVRFLADENPDSVPLDYEIIITSADNTNGQFVMIYEGGWVADGEDVDRFTVHTTREQAQAQMPFIFYVINADRQNFNLNPEINFAPNSTSAVTCQASGTSTLCGPNTVPLTGFTVTTALQQTPLAFTENDVMLNIRNYVGGQPYEVNIRAYGRLSYGPYLWLVQGGVAYPEGFDGRG